MFGRVRVSAVGGVAAGALWPGGVPVAADALGRATAADMSHETDAPPADTIAGADADALLTACYAQFSGPLHSYALHLVQSREDADDIVQEVFIRAHAHLSELRDPARMRAWLYRITTNICMDTLRRRTRFRRIFGMPVALHPSDDDRDDGPAPQVAEPGSTAGIDGVAERDHIARALRRLPPKYAACLLLHGSQGLSYKEIAESLDISPGAAAVRLTRARDMFAKEYERLRGEER